MTCSRARLALAVVAALCCVLAADAQEVNCSVPADGATPTTPEEIAAFIQCCRDTGELAATAAAIAACSELANKCPPPMPEDNPTIIGLNSGAEPFVPTPAAELLEMAIEASCVLSVKESCKGVARDVTLDPLFTVIYNTSCSDTLLNGPLVSVQGCENLTVANTLFESAVTEICEVDVSLDDVMASLEEEGGR